MEINAREFLTDEQKSELGTAFFERMLSVIESVEFSQTPKININTMLKDEIAHMFDNGDLYEEVDFKKIGRVLTERIINGVKV